MTGKWVTRGTGLPTDHDFWSNHIVDGVTTTAIRNRRNRENSNLGIWGEREWKPYGNAVIRRENWPAASVDWRRNI